MDHRLDAMLDAQDAAEYADAVAYGFNKAYYGEAFLNSDDAVVLTHERDEIGVCSRLADRPEADGVRSYWRYTGIIR